MISVVSNNLTFDIEQIPDGRLISVKESIKLIRSWPVVQFDTETTGLDPRVCRLTCMQFGYKNFTTGETEQIVVDCSSIEPEQYKKAIEKSYLIGHNLKFDLKFLYNHGITPLNVYDTMICEQLLYLGYLPQQVSFNLHDVLFRYTGINLDKSFQKEIAKSGLTTEGVVYAANDVVHLQDIRKMQMETAKSRNCLKALIVENKFVPAIAYLEWCGVKLDEEKWKNKMKEDAGNLQSYLQKLDSYVLDHPKLKKKFAEDMLFPVCDIDWNSPMQAVEVMKELGFNTKTVDKQTKEEKDSALEKLITTQKGIADDFLELYFGFKSASKRVSAYGQNFLDQINPITGRIHTTFKQFGTVTGRMSSGERANKNEDLAKLKKIAPERVGFSNLQNLSSDHITRSCFVAEEGNYFLSCDYSAEESRVSADVWQEKSLLDAFENNIDTHNLYAKMCFPEELKDVDVKDVKKVRPDLRQAAKSAEFAVNYGSNGASIAATIGMSIDKAMEMVQGIIKGMPGMAAFKKKTTKFLKKNGYIVINPITGHRIYWPNWGVWKAEENRMDSNFWDEYRTMHQGTGDSVAEMVRRHKALGRDWFEKNVLNYPIQGGSAIVMKEAAGKLFEWIVKNGFFNKILFCVFVHDELDCECPKEMADDFSKILSNIMQQAAAKYYKRLPIPAECSINTYWEH